MAFGQDKCNRGQFNGEGGEDRHDGVLHFMGL